MHPARFIRLKELPDTILKADKSNICRVGQKAVDSTELKLWSRSTALLAELLLALWTSCCSIQTFGWGETHSLYGRQFALFDAH